uniref:ATP-dependent (S)-NAD(P)H-hydrate dehydratase n=1 Tax=Chromera velia CCMP2878 TaxID=1169474 RepID=A0A0G4I2T5_9ALVE|eukprot:Cvel_10419.t1-p1 / transcript=Cvel_10419.t1 / gene=Cvel_10419 / organism=Chromera_velia_CCMP2878 / gene_product=ATP-dependent (S)-NAD(P)H-hydrate dehydratase, putative / transcript_product=ATP-dependent (S)-NAD(P)H-hydrate dehydratase, putative / location=Cvel_scaffold628:19756-24952(-) / protein_length=364 / sequence_SO=supercontig / SO=protein_coding / is_pseudo=false
MAKEPALARAVRQLVPGFRPDAYKGQAGKVVTVGGSLEYTGAPYYAAESAIRMGVDLSHVFCTKNAAMAIKGYSPELIVHPLLPCAAEGDDQGAEPMLAWLSRFDAICVGPGLGRDPATQSAVGTLLERARSLGVPTIIDADGLQLVNSNPKIVAGWSNCVLTPNVVELKRLQASLANLGMLKGNEEEMDDTSGPLYLENETLTESSDPLTEEELLVVQIARALDGPTIVRKGRIDLITNGKIVLTCCFPGALKRSGGQGDVLSGCTLAFAAWVHAKKKQSEKTPPTESGEGGEVSHVPPLMLAAWGGCTMTRACANRAFGFRKRSMVAPDLIEHIGEVFEALFEHGIVQMMRPVGLESLKGCL